MCYMNTCDLIKLIYVFNNVIKEVLYFDTIYDFSTYYNVAYKT